MNTISGTCTTCQQPSIGGLKIEKDRFVNGASILMTMEMCPKCVATSQKYRCLRDLYVVLAGEPFFRGVWFN